MKLQIGDLVPDFTTTAIDSEQNKKSWNLYHELEKKPVLLVFYPGDFTSVCTKQLCDYRDNWQQLNGFDVQVVAVSTNDSESHQKFASTHQLPFPLLDDSSKNICSSLGMLMFVGIAHRGFVLIGKDHKLKYIFKELLPFFKRTASEVGQILKGNL